MAEEEGQVSVSPEAAATPSVLGDDGNFTENWTETLKDETLRDNPTLKSAKSIEALADMTVRAQGMVGKDKIVKPTEASSQADWDDWYTAGGKPETSDYGFVRPEGFPEEHYSEEFATAAQELFHKIGLNRTQAAALFEFNNTAVIAQLTKQSQDRELSDTELKDGLYSDWGNAFEQKKHFGNVALEEGTKSESVEFKQRVVEKYGNDPDLIRLMSNLGSKFSEASPVSAEMIPTPSDIQAQIDAAQGNPAYGTEYAKHGFTKAQHRQQVNLVQKLFNDKMTSGRKTG